MNRKILENLRLLSFALCLFALSLPIPLVLASSETSQSSSTSIFQINIEVADMVALYGFDIRLSYDPSTLKLVKATPTLPWKPNLLIRNEIDSLDGEYWLAAAAVSPAPAFDGSTTVATLAFEPTGGDESAVNIARTSLVRRDGSLLQHNVEGFVLRGIHIHDVAITRIIGHPRGAYQGDPIYFDVSVKNEGTFTETFNVVVYADKDETTIGDELIVGELTVLDLPAITSRTLNFVWDTTDTSYGSYFISAQASVVQEEFDTQDNSLNSGDWIGGIYPPPHVRRTADLLAQVISILATVIVGFAGVFFVKNYWFP